MIRMVQWNCLISRPNITRTLPVSLVNFSVHVSTIMAVNLTLIASLPLSLGVCSIYLDPTPFFSIPESPFIMQHGNTWAHGEKTRETTVSIEKKRENARDGEKKSAKRREGARNGDKKNEKMQAKAKKMRGKKREKNEKRARKKRS